MRAGVGVAKTTRLGTTIAWWLLLGGIILLGAGLRLHALGNKSLWLDEITVAQVVQGDLWHTLLGARSHASAPPLDYLILHATARVCQNEYCLRFPAAMWGILSLSLVYLVGKRLLGRQAGLTATFLLSISPFHIHYSQEMKFYSILVLFSLLSIWFFLQALHHGTRKAWLLYAGAMVAGVYAHSFIAALGLVEGLWLLGTWISSVLRSRVEASRQPSRRNLIAFVLSGVLVVACYTPWIVWDFLQQAAPSREFHTALTPAFLVQTLLDMIQEHQTATPLWLWLPKPGLQPLLVEIPVSAILSYALLTAAAGGSIYLLAKQRGTLLVAIVILAPLLTVWLDNAAGYWFAQRQMIFALPAYLLLVATGLLLAGRTLGRLAGQLLGPRAKQWPLAAMLGTVLLFSLHPIQNNYRQEVQNWRAAAQLLGHRAQRGDEVFGWMWAWLPLTFYEPGLESLDIQTLDLDTTRDFQGQMESRQGRTWYIRDQTWWQDREQFEAWARSNALVTVDLGSVLVSMWLPADTPPAEARAEKQAVLKEALDLYPTFQARVDLGDSLMEENLPDQAADQYRQAIDLVPIRGLAYTRLGNAFRLQDRVDDARAAYERSIQIDPAYVGAYVQIGLLYENQGQLDQALELYRQAGEIDPQSAWVQLSLGNAYRKLGELAQAETAYETSLRLNPEYASAQMGLAYALSAQGRSHEALVHMEQATSLQPTNVNWLLALAQLYQELDQRDRAVAAYQQVLVLEADNQQAFKALHDLEP